MGEHIGHMAAEDRRGRGRDIGGRWVSKLTEVEREKGKEQKTQEGALVEGKGDLSWSILL